MHLPDGFAPVGLAAAGYAGAAALMGLSLSRIARLPNPHAAMPRAAMLTAVFFAASAIAIPAPPTSVHLVLPGLMGVVLGWFAAPAIFVGLFLQAVLFGHGGLTTLGLNWLVLAPSALAAWAVWRALAPAAPTAASVIEGSGAVLLSLGVFIAFVLIGLPPGVDPAAERAALGVLALAHLPLVVAEGVLVAATLRVLARVEPGLAPRV